MVVRVALVAVLSLAIGAAPARAQDPPTVALVGSLQSELGCPGDWQPECPQTRLQPVAGSPGLFRATFDVPAGAYEYKVALNNSLGRELRCRRRAGRGQHRAQRARRARSPSPMTTPRT